MIFLNKNILSNIQNLQFHSKKVILGKNEPFNKKIRMIFLKYLQVFADREAV